MKKILITLCIIPLIFITGCTVSNKTNKTTYKVSENAKLDHYAVVLDEFVELDTIDYQEPQNDIYIKYIFTIKNTSGKEQLISEDNFAFLNDNNEVLELTNLANSSFNLKPNEEKEYIVIYDTNINKEYNILFYSKVATNNILFKGK